MAVAEIQDNTLQETLEQHEWVLLDFWAPWCGPCNLLAPELEKLDELIGHQVKIVKMNVDDNPESVSQYGIMSIPAMKLFHKGELADSATGFAPAEAIADWVKQTVK